MSQGRRLYGILAVLMSGLLLLLAVGCNESADFDPESLFSLEDYAQDQDYALNFVRMMNSWRLSTQDAKEFLDTNVEGLTFLESVPAGWEQVNPSLRSYPWSVLFIVNPNDPTEFLEASDDDQWLDSTWYYSSFQDATYRLAAIDRGVPGTASLAPAKVDYMRLSFLSSPFGGSFGIGDSVSVGYTNDFQNPSMVEGTGMFWNSDVVQASTAPTDIASYAAMTNAWGGVMTNMAADPSNPQGEFEIRGQTVLVRADLVETVTLAVNIDASIRSNGKGDGIITVAGEKRAEVFFEYYDTSFHGYYKLRSSDFEEAIRF
ncbi:hypothetical protein KQI52_10455 [bacterium]|nr:hypothetical protein [bacterium]